MTGTALFSCKEFEVFRRENGKHYIVAPDGAGVIALDAQERILLTREYRPSLDRVIWRIPAGKVDAGETLLQAARRELREEAGFDARQLMPFSERQETTAFIKRTKAIFIARDLFASPLDSGDEPVQPDVHFLPAEKVLELLNTGELTGDVAAALYRFLHLEKRV